jgi:hypothetical protein
MRKNLTTCFAAILLGEAVQLLRLDLLSSVYYFIPHAWAEL